MIDARKKEMERLESMLGEIKTTLQTTCLGIEEIRREIEVLKNEKRIQATLLLSKLDNISRNVIKVGYVMKDMTVPEIMTAYEVRHPEIFDTTPIDMTEDLMQVVQEIQGEVAEKCEAFGKKMTEITRTRSPLQCLGDYVFVLKDLRDEIISRRNRVHALQERRKKTDKDSNEQKNAAVLIMKVRSMIKPLEAFTAFVLDSFFKKRKKVLSEVWRDTLAIEEMYEPKSEEYKEIIPSASSSAQVSVYLAELAEIAKRHEMTHKANCLVKSGNMSVLERRKMLAGIK